ncbi:tyrosyl-DNA phosphodiesterase-domain-containing protein [Xylogone sp. PMI_703]|nr:tyrosyl-DNA phosphodiesterase-domain-containing protein [Xylogone sp. PMI_703]
MRLKCYGIRFQSTNLKSYNVSQLRYFHEIVKKESKMEEQAEERARKRRRLEPETNNRHSPHKTLERSISPPPPRNGSKRSTPGPSNFASGVLPSQFQLTTIRDLPDSANRDTVSLKDILGDPLIAECWEFNYLHDLDFLMDAFDPDVKDSVKVHVVHGFWKNDDPRRTKIQTFSCMESQCSADFNQEKAKSYKNITLHTAYMGAMFGTHHSKMLILLRHDATAQVIIHTANMIPFDWTNMTQAVWRSPLLPEITSGHHEIPQSDVPGTGAKFKTDLLNYLRSYDDRRSICAPLVKALSNYDFSEIRAALVSSVPGKHKANESVTQYGWQALKKAISVIPVESKEPEIIIQISSIATLGTTDTWLKDTFFKSMRSKGDVQGSKSFRIIFPTADEVRRSLNGYDSGSALHTKIQSVAQQKQFRYLKPLLHHWAGDGEQHASASNDQIERDAGRKRAAPHIKTYVRFADSSHSSIEWMMVTSANLSKQAWGEVVNAAGETRVSSYEIGVLVWPGLFGENARMVPTFKSDTPDTPAQGDEVLVGARMPYSLPLIPYGRDDEPWVATATYTEPDWMGQQWNMD